MYNRAMGNWSNILQEINSTKSQFDSVRAKYIKELSNYTNRNVIAYYSAWLSKNGVQNLDISDADMTVLARDVAKKVENEMEYPGQIKVNVIRETRTIEYAK